MHRTIPHALPLTLSLLVAAGCGDKKNDPTPEQGGKAAERGRKAPEPAAERPVAAELFGKAVAPPGALGKLSIGMPVAEAMAAAPELFPKGAEKSYQSTDAAGWKDVRFAVGLDDAKAKIDRLTVSMPPAGRDAIVAAWGPGLEAKDRIDKARTFWFDPATGWRAYLEVAFSDTVHLEYHRYVPAAQLLGGGGPLGVAPQALLGATVDELRARHAAHLVERDAAQAAKDRADLEKFAGQKLDGKLGAAKPDVRLELPPTEWEDYWTRIHFHWTDDHRVRVVYFKLPYGAYGPAKEELLALLKATWGEPTTATKYGRELLVFRAKGPRITVEDDTIGHGWSVEIADE